MWLSKYLSTSSLLARSSNNTLSLKFSTISGMNLEVTRIFTPSLAWSLKISERNLDRQPSDVWHSSSASTTIKISEYMATTDWRALESSSNVGHKDLSDSSVEMAFPGSAALTGLQVGYRQSVRAPVGSSNRCKQYQCPVPPGLVQSGHRSWLQWGLFSLLQESLDRTMFAWGYEAMSGTTRNLKTIGQ